jgi:hypothetical protein
MLDGLIPDGFGEERRSCRPYSFNVRESSCSKRACDGVVMEVADAAVPESGIPSRHLRLCASGAEAVHIEFPRRSARILYGALLEANNTHGKAKSRRQERASCARLGGAHLARNGQRA